MAARGKLTLDKIVFAVGVGFCAVPVMLVGSLNKGVRDTVRPYAQRVRDLSLSVFDRSYAAFYEVIAHEPAPPLPAHSANARLHSMQLRAQRAELGGDEPLADPESPVHAASEIRPEAEPAVAAPPPEAAEPSRALRVRGVVNLNNLESAKRAMHARD